MFLVAIVIASAALSVAVGAITTELDGRKPSSRHLVAGDGWFITGNGEFVEV